MKHNVKTQNNYQSSLLVAFSLLLIGAAVAIHQFKIPPIMATLAKSLNITEKNTHWLMSIFTLVCLAFSIPAGGLVQRVKIKTSILISASLVIIGAVLCSFNSAFVF